MVSFEGKWCPLRPLRTLNAGSLLFQDGQSNHFTLASLFDTGGVFLHPSLAEALAKAELWQAISPAIA